MRQKEKNCALALSLTLLLPWLVLLLLWPRQAVPADGPARLEAEEKRPLIALTFDDGPRRSTTTDLLDGLAQRGVKATFFLVGEMIPDNEDLVARMADEGHQIGVHTYDHRRLTDLNAADFDSQIGRTRAMISEITGLDRFLLRPPYGMVDNGVKKRSGTAIILWSIDPEDWNDKNADRIVNHIVSNAQDGDIILLHDIYPTSVEAALRVVDALHQKGFLFVTVEELAQQRHVELTAGEVYQSFHP